MPFMGIIESKSFGKHFPERVRKFIRREYGLGKSHRHHKHVPNGQAVRLEPMRHTIS